MMASYLGIQRSLWMEIVDGTGRDEDRECHPRPEEQTKSRCPKRHGSSRPACAGDHDY